MWRILFASIVLTLAAPPSPLHASHSSGADALASLAGTWLGVVQLDDRVVPHVETLTLSADGHVVTDVWAPRRGNFPGGARCAGRTALEEPLCKNPHRTSRGRLSVDTARGTLSIAELERVGPGLRLAGSDRDERMAHTQLWLTAPGEWTFARRGDLLTLGRTVIGEDRRPQSYVRSLYRVDALFAGELIDAMDALGESAAAAGCLLETAHGDAAAWRELRLRVRQVARVHRSYTAHRNTLLAASADADGGARARAELREIDAGLHAARAGAPTPRSAGVARLLKVTEADLQAYVQPIGVSAAPRESAGGDSVRPAGGRCPPAHR